MNTNCGEVSRLLKLDAYAGMLDSCWGVGYDLNEFCALNHF